ncbi:lipocalin-like domain-containing protein [Paraburkholderia sp. LEh10]|uniref:lipocalin-like domain-containing protein n=1 Tax=Paraburkholderia sp. LEh10 TaxID=2821353 RepID=UPI001AE46874|nr:lipocalin-like domain-containing protein [Paraburkholderia sp. LEh10]
MESVISVSSPEIRDRIKGAWKLAEWYELRTDGSKVYPLGDDATGQILYTPDGHVAAQVSRRARQRFASRRLAQSRSRRCSPSI